MESANILGVRVDKVSMLQAVSLVESWLKEKNCKKYIVTPNPEFIMAAQKDEEFKKVLNKSDLAIPDGAGLKLASDIVCTIPGVDFLEELCKESSEKGFTVGFLGGQNGVAKEAAECLQKKYSGLTVIFSEDGPKINLDGEPEDQKIRRSEDQNVSDSPIFRFSDIPVDILFVGFGQIKQEKWIVKNLDKIPAKVAMGVGGSFDYLSGRVPRAPIFMRNLGLEWLFRLILQPWRIKRQLALLRFLFLIRFT